MLAATSSPESVAPQFAAFPLRLVVKDIAASRTLCAFFLIDPQR